MKKPRKSVPPCKICGIGKPRYEISTGVYRAVCKKCKASIAVSSDNIEEIQDLWVVMMAE